MADMDVAVGVRGPVMEDEFRQARRGRAQPLVEAQPVPAREQLGLLLRQPGAHGKVGLRQE